MANPVDRYALIISVSDEAVCGEASVLAEAGFEKKGYEIHRANLVTLPLWAKLLKGKIDRNDQVVFFVAYPETGSLQAQTGPEPRLKALLDIRSYGQRAVIVNGDRQLGASLPIRPSVVHVDTQDQIDHFVHRLKPDQAVFVSFSPDFCGPCKPYQIDYALQAAQAGRGNVFLHTSNKTLALETFHLRSFPSVVRINHQGELYFIHERADIVSESRRAGLHFSIDQVVAHLRRDLLQGDDMQISLALTAAWLLAENNKLSAHQLEDLAASIGKIAAGGPNEPQTTNAQQFLDAFGGTKSH